MIKALREMKKKTDKKLSVRHVRRDEEGRVIVNMTVKDDNDFLSVFSENDTPVISTDVAEFIENSIHAVSPGAQLALHIHSDCIDEREKVEYSEAIREYYTERYVANERELRRNRLIIWLLATAGVFVLSVAIGMEYWLESRLWSEVIDIVAWVLLWEAVDIGVFSNREHYQNRLRYLSLMEMKIVFGRGRCRDSKEKESDRE